MSIESGNQVPAAIVRIEGDMTIYRAAELKQTLLAALAVSNSIDIDLSAVEDIDSAGVQLMLMMSKELRARRGRLSVVGASRLVCEVFGELGLAMYFLDPLDELAPAE